MRNGETWFVASDVCEVLKHPNPRQVISRLEDDERGVLSLGTLAASKKLILSTRAACTAWFSLPAKPKQ